MQNEVGQEGRQLAYYTDRPMRHTPFGAPHFQSMADDNCCWFWYRVKVLGIRYNLFAGIETLSLSIYEPIAMQILLGGSSPNFGRGLS